MTSPFPGMDPYLEAYWGDVHTRMALYSCDALNTQLPGDLVARVEEYLAVETDESDAVSGYYPDVQIAEPRRKAARKKASVGHASTLTATEPLLIDIRQEPRTVRSVRILEKTGGKVITAIEFLSLANKDGAGGRRAYEEKQNDFIAAGVSLVEIDLLREGRYVLYPDAAKVPPECRGPYRICVVRGWRRGRAELYPLSLREKLPTIRIPLRKTDPGDVLLDLQLLMERCYVNGRYAETIDYRIDPLPPLASPDAAWADKLLKKHGFR
jgi:hypothetical protein